MRSFRFRQLTPQALSELEMIKAFVFWLRIPLSFYKLRHLFFGDLRTLLPTILAWKVFAFDGPDLLYDRLGDLQLVVVTYAFRGFS